MQKLFDKLERLHDSHAGGEEEAQNAYDDALNAVFNLQLECHRHTQAHKSKKDGSTKWSMIEMWPMLVMTQCLSSLAASSLSFVHCYSFGFLVPSKAVFRVLSRSLKYFTRYLLLMGCMYMILHSALVHMLACNSRWCVYVGHITICPSRRLQKDR